MGYVCKIRSGMFYTSMFQVMRSEIDSLQSNQEETDTCIVIYIKYAEHQGFKSAAVASQTQMFSSSLFFTPMIWK